MSLGIEFRQKIPSGATFFKVKETIKKLRLKTVCEEAKCPNRTECYAQGTLTFQILGDLCTRRCGFCAEKTGRPLAVDAAEPQRILETVLGLKLSHVVLTAPARDDLADGGAAQFAAVVKLIKKESPSSTVETLTSDFEGNPSALETVLSSGPDVFNHNIETVRRLTHSVRAKATYDRSLSVLNRAAKFGLSKVKSGLMVGLGETYDELRQTFFDLSARGVRLVTVGQYLQPSKDHLPIQKFYSADEFLAIRKMASPFPFENIFCGPLVRSSYHAKEMFRDITEST
jgi:lipoic acid synthetase